MEYGFWDLSLGHNNDNAIWDLPLGRNKRKYVFGTYHWVITMVNYRGPHR